MDVAPQNEVTALKGRLERFMQDHVYPNEIALFEAQGNAADPWTPPPMLADLKKMARAQGLWNLFLPDTEHGAGLDNLQYAPLAEMMGRSQWAPEIFNCDAPDSGNMELLIRYGSAKQKAQWLEGLLKGETRSAFAMTEPAVASSDATNIETSILRDGDDYIVNGRKWWTSGAGNRSCRFLIVMGQSDPGNPDRHRRQSMIIVPLPHPGVRIVRPLSILGDLGEPHGHMEVEFDQVRVPAANMILGEGRGFEIAQGRLGPGRIHHCMRMIGLAERALERLCRRLEKRVTFGSAVARQSVWSERIAEARCALDQARLLTLNAAHRMDTVGNKAAMAEIAMIKIVAPRVATEIVDMAIQGFGGGGFTDDIMAAAYRYARTTRIADGPDEVHRNHLARLELRRHRDVEEAATGAWSDVRMAQRRYGAGQSPPAPPGH